MGDAEHRRGHGDDRHHRERVGIGAATAARLQSAGHRIIGVDLRDADIVADLANPEGRSAAAAATAEACGGVLDGLVTCAGLGGLPDRPGPIVAEVNYFGTVELIDALQPALAAGTAPAVVAIGSNSTTVQPGIPADLVERLLAADHEGALERAEGVGSVLAYPATKVAVSWWVRRNATSERWVGSGIRLNVVAPGMIETALVAEQKADRTMAPMLDLLPIPVGRPGRPDEIAAVIEFLLGPDATFLCGSIVLADGGSEALLRPDAWPAPWDLDLADAGDVFGAEAES